MSVYVFVSLFAGVDMSLFVLSEVWCGGEWLSDSFCDLFLFVRWKEIERGCSVWVICD